MSLTKEPKLDIVLKLVDLIQKEWPADEKGKANFEDIAPALHFVAEQMDNVIAEGGR